MTSVIDIERAWEQVRRNPRDLEPRRHLARLLIAQGNPLGEFLDLVLTPEQEVPAGGYKRANELFQRHGDEWFPLAPGETLAFKRSWTQFVGRGLPDALGVSPRGPPAEELIEWWAAHHPIRHVHIRHPEPAEALSALERRGLLALVDTLELHECTLTDAAVDVLANATAGLRSLQLTKPVGLDASRAERLFRGSGLAGITFLGIAATPLEAPVMRALWSGVPKLESLRLFNVELGKERLDLPPGTRRRWTELHLEGSITASQALELIRGLDLSVTRSLRLRGASVRDGLMTHLRDAVRTGELQALHALDLQSTSMGAEQLEVLLEAPPPSLVHLDVSSNNIGEKGLKALAAYARQSPTLKSLPLTGIHVGSGVMEAASDWDGSYVGSFEKGLTVQELHQKFGFPVALKTT